MTLLIAINIVLTVVCLCALAVNRVAFASDDRPGVVWWSATIFAIAIVALVILALSVALGVFQ